MRTLPIALLGCLACAAARAPTRTAPDPCTAGWRAFSAGDTRAAIARYEKCESATAPPMRPPPDADAGIEAFYAERDAEDEAVRQAVRRRDCPRSTMVDEAMRALGSLAGRDVRAFRHFMAMSCHDAIVGRSAIPREIHPCALLERPPRPAEISALRAALQRYAPPVCSPDANPEVLTRGEPGWNCAPYGVQDKPFLP